MPEDAKEAFGHGVRAANAEEIGTLEAIAEDASAMTPRLGPDKPFAIDKSAIAVPRRHRNKEHLRYVAQQPCLICGRRPCDAHHVKHMQPHALGRKVSDEFTVPLCRIHHRLVHRVGNEAAWWQDTGIDPTKLAAKLRADSCHRSVAVAF